MSFFKKLFNKNNPTAVTKEELIEQNLCPNCWGKQEYEGQFQQYVIDQTKANNGTTERKAFILQFVEDRVSGIKMQKENGELVCQTCQKKYLNHHSS